MNCCGQKRLQWQQEAIPQKTELISTEPLLENPVSLCYHGTDDCLIKGSQTGYLYLFAARDPGLMVDGRDAPMFLEKSQKFSLSKTDQQ